ncbi:uncharacterized protein LOC121503586 [Cheilinus undulatus]|uniref:uncharacterized protein LOC121503586 n=1 Tax=Cheilinus undulatus TaxID=241271 RepID=UPI001BD617EA|nr:uncharacterized protein LOC121503586 [Cheilinus undulatus]XP_041633991.1 uncharacterized protein LOC121503586 [Cheilinus undulatus]XP_041633992.1 uncharacterized protein LOC121503586 [Cheilinus undulatus]
MSSSWLALVVMAAIFISMVLLAVVCLDCRIKGPPASISQVNASDEYIPSLNFRVIHPSQPSLELNPIHLQPGLLSPFPPATDPGSQRRHPSFTRTETESNPSYENPGDGSEYVNTESDQEDTGYIIVLPEGDHSRASTPSSDVRHDYENCPDKKEEREYLNVEPVPFQRSITNLSVLSSSSSSSDDEGNYVNQPSIHCQPSA